MGFRTGSILISVAFLYGVLFIASIYDFPLIYGAFTEEKGVLAEQFYLSVYQGPRAIGALLHAMMAVGIIGCAAKLHTWSELAKYFDGTSIALLVGAISMYCAVIVPNLRLLSDPTSVALLNGSSIKTQRDSYIKGRGGVPPLAYTEPLTSDERFSALMIIGATNTIIMVLLAGVVLLQGGGSYMEEQEKKEANKQRALAAEELRQQIKGKNAVDTVETKKSK